MTTNNDLPDYRAVSDQIRRDALSVDPSELHGSLCGLLCGGGTDSTRWLTTVLADAELAAPAAGTPIADLYQNSCKQLQSPEFGFELLLPDDNSAIDRRGDALLTWCQGFLGGFGLAGASPKSLSEDAQEALEDLGRIAAADLSYDDPDADEEALTEITEFVRIAALLLHGDCVLGGQRRAKRN